MADAVLLLGPTACGKSTLAMALARQLPLEIVSTKMTKAEQKDRARHLLALVGLEGFEDKRPSELSGGMRQRASLCRAIVHKPEVLILDEPFGALDAFTREEMNALVEEIWLETRTTIVFVTHSIEEAVLMGHRVVVLKGRPSSVFEVVEVDLPSPRDRSTLGHPRFAELREHVWGTLMDEVRAAEYDMN